MRKNKNEKKSRRFVDAPSIGHAKARIQLVEIDNPHYSRTHAGLPGNPKTISAAMNLRESPVALMAAKGHLGAHHIKAADKFRRLWEILGGAGAGSFDYSREPVDGGGARESITDSQIEAGQTLKVCQSVIGRRAFSIVEKVAGEGRTIAEISVTKREKTTNADYLRDALEDLAKHWGFMTTAKKL
ncbi:hypothetical protein [Pseudomonas monteilii]|uniref:hypothetical protein n=1 Tax=Pseudomonas monteilii TaxID=76759 RepID=UPI001376F8CB|nr:hypothetical protein [Pseudomonas monteilii]NBB07872.1 hypothetical protein [Pseudomonas monteilii]